jgi:hypothetical protein
MQKEHSNNTAGFQEPEWVGLFHRAFQPRDPVGVNKV